MWRVRRLVRLLLRLLCVGGAGVGGGEASRGGSVDACVGVRGVDGCAGGVCGGGEVVGGVAVTARERVQRRSL